MREAFFVELFILVFVCCAFSASGGFLKSTNFVDAQASAISMRSTKINSTEVQTRSNTSKPQLVFLFLVYDRINNEEIWDRFFAPAVHGIDFIALVHCKSLAGCQRNIRSPHRYEIIPSVETKYCVDLVSGMNALLQAGVSYAGRSARPDDKMVFISDSTLPVKPFTAVQNRLLGTGTSSNFCIFPRNEWAEIQEPASTGLVPSIRAAVKHHQWMILSRAHAEQVLQRGHEYRDLMQQFHMNTFSTLKNTGCLDEFWHFAIIFGTIAHATNPQMIQMTGLAGRPLSTTDYEIQGQCDTFVQWVPRAAGAANNMTALTKLLSADAGVDMTPASDKRPAAFHRFSKNSVLQMRDSWFLFARKVDDKAGFAGCEPLVEVFDKLIFSTPPQQFTVPATWVGQGNWVDTRNLMVTITSHEGAIRLVGKGSGMDAKGTFCNNKIEVVFANGYRASATITPDNQYLSWDTGVTWRRQ